MVSAARKDIRQAQDDEATAPMLQQVHKHLVEETVSLNPAFDYEGLDEEVAQALLDISYYGERHREHLARYARSRANRFVFIPATPGAAFRG